MMKRLWFGIALLVVLIGKNALASVAKNEANNQESLPSLQWIVVAGNDDSLYLIHPDGSGRRDIDLSQAGEDVYSSNIKWSPDGRYLAFTDKFDARVSAIWIYRLADGSFQQLVTDSNGGYDWYPDSRAILFDKYAERGVDPESRFGCEGDYLDSGPNAYDGLYRYDLETGDETLVISPPEKYPLFSPRFSSDGRQVLFFQHEWDSTTSYSKLVYYVTEVESPSRFYPLNPASGGCSWAADSNRIACHIWDRNCAMARSCPIAIYSSTGEELDRFPGVRERYDRYPIWSPVNDELVFSTTDEYDPIGGDPCSFNPQPFIIPGDFPVELYSFTDQQRRSLVNGIPLGWSPDGQYLLITSGIRLNADDSRRVFIVDRQGGELILLANGNWAVWQPVTPPPEAITDLAVEPLSNSDGSHPLKMTWTAPLIESMVYDFQARFAEYPLTEENWERASLITGELTLDGDTFTLEAAHLPLNTHLYIGVKTWVLDGSMSALSNVVHLIDSGFRVNPNGYSFHNYFDDIDDVTVDVVRDIYGDAFCCKPWTQLPGNECELNFFCEEWRNAANAILPNGRCLGMAGTSVYFYRNPGMLNSQLNTTQLYTLNIDPDETDAVRQEIAQIHVRQLTNPYQSNISNEYSMSTPSSVFVKLMAMMQGGLEDQGVISYHYENEDYNNFHAITPVALEEDGNGWWKVWVYDSQEYPNEPEEYRVMRIYPNSDGGRWEYNGFEGGEPGSIWFVSLSTLYDSPLLHIYDDIRLDQIWVIGNASILIKNTAGHRIGYIDNQLVNEIEGAFTQPINWESLEASMPIFYLPADEVYTVTLEQLPGSSAEEAALSYFTGNSVLTIEGIQLVEAVQEELVFDPQNTRISYSNEEEQVVNIRLVVDEEAQSTRIDLSDIRLPAGEQLDLARDASTQQVTYSQSSEGTYQLDVIVSSEQGTSTFRQTLVEILRQNQHTFNLAEWTQGEAFKLLIDEDGDGEPDTTRRLVNEVAGATQTTLTTNVVIGIILLAAGSLLSAAGIGGLVVNQRRMRKYQR
jgi:hypothetical protein